MRCRGGKGPEVQSVEVQWCMCRCRGVQSAEVQQRWCRADTNMVQQRFCDREQSRMRCQGAEVLSCCGSAEEVIVRMFV